MTRWFIDTEFHEDGKTIDLISLAAVANDGEEHYWVSSEFDEQRCNDWVKANVLPQLPDRSLWVPRAQIATEVRELFLRDGEPEIWGYFADYDWVVLCQLFGTMMDLPKGFPMFCRDLKQLMSMLGVKKDNPRIPVQSEGQHDALCDARWIRDTHITVMASTWGVAF